MKRLIVNADDFGLCASVNRGVLEAHRRGIVTSASLLATAPGFEEAAPLHKRRGEREPERGPSALTGIRATLTLVGK